MTRLFSYKNGKVKIIWNEQPMFNDYDPEWVTSKIEKKTTPFLDTFMLGVELMVHTGPRICYGMLGAQVQPCAERDIVGISIAYTHGNTAKYENSLLLNDNYVYKGLPQEYAEEVINSVLGTISEKESYPQCDVSFAYAANCEVGSSPMFFAITAEILTNLICTCTEEKILNMTVEEFTGQYIRACQYFKGSNGFLGIIKKEEKL